MKTAERREYDMKTRRSCKRMISVILCVAVALTVVSGGVAFAQETGTAGTEGGMCLKGCTLESGHEGECVLAPAGTEDGPADEESTEAEQLQARIDALPAPEETVGMDDASLEALKAEMDAIYAEIDALADGAQALDTAKLGALAQAFAPAPMMAVVPVQVDESGYTEWTSTDSLPSSGKYKLMNSVTLSGDVTVGKWAGSRPGTPSDTLVLDLNGHTVTAAGGRAFFVQVTGGLTIEDSAGGGKITNAGVSDSMKTLVQVNGGAFTLKGGTLENVTSGGTALFLNGNSTTIISGGTVENVAQGANAVYVNGGSFSMEGGSVKTSTTYSSKAAIYANSSAASIEISGGNIESATVGVYAAVTPVTVTGGAITAGAQAFQTRYATIPEDSTVTVESGGAVFYTFSGSDNKVYGGDFDAPAIVEEYTSEQPGTATIFGGTYTVSPMDYVDGGSAAASYTEAGKDGVFVVGTSDKIADKVSLAPTGSQIEVLQGDIDLSIAADGVTVINSGNGTVKVNNAEVTQDPLVTHTHHAVKIDAKEATATENGNIEYWYCADCGKYFSGEALTQEISLADTVIPATGEPGARDVYYKDASTGISLHADTRAVPEGTYLVAKPVTEAEQDYAAAKELLKDKAGKFVLYDITLVNAQGEAIQPAGPVIIGIPVPDGYDKTALAVHHIGDDHTAEEYGVAENEGMAYIQTEHFSKYALAEKGRMSGTGGTAADGGTPKTGDTADMTPYILLVTAAAAAAAVTLVVRNKKQHQAK